MPWDAGGEGPAMGCAESRCRELAPDPRAPGETCISESGPWSGVDDCEPGAFCWNVDAVTNEGVCVALCIGSEAEPACADAELSCFVWTSTSVTACVQACDPLAPTCALDERCVSSAGSDQPTVCLPADLDVPTGNGAPCEWELGCGDGFVCVDGAEISACDAEWCCTSVCDLDAPQCGPEDPVCSPVLGGPSGVGWCGVG